MRPPLPLPPLSRQTPGTPLLTPGPSALPGLASLTSSVAISPSPPRPSSKPADRRAETPAPGLPVFFSGGLPHIGSVAGVGAPLLPSSSSNSASLGLGSAAAASARPPSTGPNHNHNPNAFPAISSASSLRLYSPSRSHLPSETPAPLSPGSRPLNVKDALSYLEMIKVKFQDKPVVYTQFADIMKDFKSQAIDTPGVIDRISGLFNGHTALIQGFNTFLPQGYRIDCTVDRHDHNLITVTTPSGTTTRTTGGPPRHILSSHASPAPFAAPTHPSLTSGPLPPLSPFYHGNSPATAHAIAALQGDPSLLPGAAPPVPSSTLSSTPGPSHTDAGPSTKDGPMTEFNQAVNYVNKIKQRFASDPDTYKQFLEILQTYQKEQRPIAEVYQQVNVLFNNQRDLLEDFQHLVPDNGAGGGGGGAGMGGTGFGGNGGLFGMMAQMTAEGSWGRMDDKGSKGKEPSGSGGASSKTGGGGDKDKRKDGKERERERDREQERERLEKKREKEREKRKAESAAAKKKKRGLEKETEKNGKAGNSKRTKVAHKDAEDPTSPPPAQQYHSNPNQPSTSYLAPLYIQSQNPLTTPDEVLGGACPTTHASSFELASSSMTAQEMFDCLLCHGCTNLTSQLNFNREHVNAVAGGGFGDIYRGELRNGTAVAIKTLRHHMLAQDTAPKALKRAAREIYTWSKAQHKNVQELLGVIMFQGQLGMVSPWMDNGNLEEYIRKNPDVDRHDLCGQVASGVAYLHGIDMVHGDLKARNVLVDKGGIARLSDFDHSILTNCTLLFTETTNVGGGTLRWMAPELLLSSGEDDAAPVTRSKQTDIYALGMTMLEIISGRVPYVEYKVDRGIIRALDRKEFPTRPREVSSDWIWSLLEACWNHDPEARPSASWVYDQLLGYEPEYFLVM